MQNHYNLLYREEEREMLPLCAAEGIGVIPWSPLARGRLTRAWDDSTERSRTDAYGKTLYAAQADADRRVVERVAELASSARPAQGSGRAGLDAPQARGHRADRRRVEAAATWTTPWPPCPWA